MTQYTIGELVLVEGSFRIHNPSTQEVGMSDILKRIGLINLKFSIKKNVVRFSGIAACTVTLTNNIWNYLFELLHTTDHWVGVKSKASIKQIGKKTRASSVS